MKLRKETIKKKDDFLINVFIVISVVFIGIIGLFFLQKYSEKNQYVCSYLGRLWLADKENIGIQRCYTYEEFYK